MNLLLFRIYKPTKRSHWSREINILPGTAEGIDLAQALLRDGKRPVQAHLIPCKLPDLTSEQVVLNFAVSAIQTGEGKRLV